MVFNVVPYATAAPRLAQMSVPAESSGDGIACHSGARMPRLALANAAAATFACANRAALLVRAYPE